MTRPLRGGVMMLRILRASLGVRRRVVLITSVAVALGASLPATLIGLQGVQGKLEQELSRYGANLLIVPKDGSTLDQRGLASLDRMIAEGAIESYAPLLSLMAKVGERDVAVAGIDVARAADFSNWWSVEGGWPTGGSSALLGANVAAKLALRAGDALTVKTPGAERSFSVTGVLRTGGSEENQIFVELGAAQQLAGRPGRLSLIQARAKQSGELEPLVRALAAELPDAEARTPLQIVKGEAVVLSRLRRLVMIVAGAVLFASILAVFATMAGSVLKRRREVGLMKALGGEERSVLLLFAAEALAIGLVGGILGSAVGLFLAEAIAWQVFETFIAPSLLQLLVGLAVGIAVSLGASLAPLRQAARVAPAAVLRGE